MARQIALLRGINVGTAKRVAMGDLRTLLGEAGYGDVRTHLQSGNVLLDARVSGDRLARALEQLLAERLGMTIAVIVRTRDELADVVAHNPLGDVADDPRRHQVSFLSAAPDPAVVERIEQAVVAPERIAFHGREIYVWHANGIQNSPAAKLLADRRLGVTATTRNWNTVTKLLELATV
jgi:uncharacterized protein (DUF1697 family)